MTPVSSLDISMGILPLLVIGAGVIYALSVIAGLLEEIRDALRGDAGDAERDASDARESPPEIPDAALRYDDKGERA